MSGLDTDGCPKYHPLGRRMRAWKEPMPTECPLCQTPLELYDFGTKAFCSAHGIVADKSTPAWGRK